MTLHMKQVMRETEIVSGISCDVCGIAIRQVFDEGGNGDKMLTVAIHGGYGEYIDGSESTDLCGNCATKLEAEWPSLFSDYRKGWYDPSATANA